MGNDVHGDNLGTTENSHGFIFQGKTTNYISTVFKAKLLAANLKSALSKAPYKAKHWQKPSSSWLKLNTDGGSLPDGSRSVAGGVCRDEMGEWKWGYTSRLPGCEVEEEEALALQKGLTFAREEEYRG